MQASLAYRDLPRVDSGRPHRNQHLAPSGNGILDVPDLEDVDPAVIVEPHRAHASRGQSLRRRLSCRLSGKRHVELRTQRLAVDLADGSQRYRFDEVDLSRIAVAADSGP